MPDSVTMRRKAELSHNLAFRFPVAESAHFRSLSGKFLILQKPTLYVRIIKRHSAWF